jgi:hypothetical protein
LRYIDNRQLRRFANLRELEAANARIAVIAEDERGKFIDDHQALCSNLRNGLWAVGSAKCWYSEAQLQEVEGHVEHYRPKKRVTGAQLTGYWWRAFDWRNLRLAHPTVNRRVTDYLTGRLAGKGGYFPLSNEGQRATSSADEVNEEPILLDPTVFSDTQLICFSPESGAPRPRFGKDEDEWLHRRASESIDYYHLDEALWNARRQDLMAEVRTLCDELEAIALQEPRDEIVYNRTVDELVEKYLNPFAEFSSACWQVVSDRGLLEVIVAGLG